MDRSRNVSLDILRIIAAFSVVVLHVCARYISLNPVNSYDFAAANFYDSINRFGVPVFVMISGALFLSKARDVDTKRLWLHNIIRILAVYLVWGFFYYFFQSAYLWNFNLWNAGIVRTIKGIVYGSDHLWFLPMIAGLYALIPMLRVWTSKASRQNVEYVIILFFFFNILLGSLDLLLDSSLVTRIVGMAQIKELSGYLGYFILGYYLTNFEVYKRIRFAIYASVPVDIVLNFLISEKFSLEKGAYHPGIYDSFGIFTFAEVTALFMAVIYINNGKKIPDKFAGFIKNVSADTFGVYLMHVMILDYVFYEGYFSYLYPSIAFVLPVSLVLFIVSCLISAGLRRIPVIGRYLA